MRKLFGYIIFVFLLFCVYLDPVAAQTSPNTITLDNQSGEFAVVKLIGPTKVAVEVPSGQERTVNVEAGDYYLLGRYGSSSEEYKYTKGDPFEVVQSSNQYSVITITLHKVLDGNYDAKPVSGEEFENVQFADLITPEQPPRKPSAALKGEPIADHTENAKTNVETPLVLSTDAAQDLGQQTTATWPLAGDTTPPQLAGLELGALTGSQLTELGLPNDTKDVIVTKVEEKSPAHRAGILQQDIFQEIGRSNLDGRKKYHIKQEIDSLEELSLFTKKIEQKM